jgi:hypothetical protein
MHRSDNSLGNGLTAILFKGLSKEMKTSLARIDWPESDAGPLTETATIPLRFFGKCSTNGNRQIALCIDI